MLAKLTIKVSLKYSNRKADKRYANAIDWHSADRHPGGGYRAVDGILPGRAGVAFLDGWSQHGVFRLRRRATLPGFRRGRRPAGRQYLPLFSHRKHRAAVRDSAAAKCQDRSPAAYYRRAAQSGSLAAVVPRF